MGGMGPVLRPHVVLPTVNGTGPESRTRTTRKPSTRYMSLNHFRIESTSENAFR